MKRRVFETKVVVTLRTHVEAPDGATDAQLLRIAKERETIFWSSWGKWENEHGWIPQRMSELKPDKDLIVDDGPLTEK